MLRRIDLEEQLLDHRLVFLAVDGDFDRIAHGLGGDRADRVGIGRREQQRLPVFRRGLDDGLDRFLEAHVEHAVGLVEHQRAQAAQVERLLGRRFQHAAGRADDDVRDMRERGQLRAERHAAGTA